jgi:hypothetical protein
VNAAVHATVPAMSLQAVPRRVPIVPLRVQVIVMEPVTVLRRVAVLEEAVPVVAALVVEIVTDHAMATAIGRVVEIAVRHVMMVVAHSVITLVKQLAQVACQSARVDVLILAIITVTVNQKHSADE